MPNSEYLFVSKNGFETIKNGTTINLDATTPDNIIEDEYSENGTTTYIWKNGKKELYTGGLPDGAIETQYEGENSGVYEWKSGKKILKRKLTQQDLEDRDKALKEDEELLKSIMNPK
ncbi:MAG: hypothetical protein JWO44_2275 [Bacteroidetes bacterium]|nr:hypothetical protein [Bacteroidota bacterium]